jgi:hypothetical protein
VGTGTRLPARDQLCGGAGGNRCAAHRDLGYELQRRTCLGRRRVRSPGPLVVAQCPTISGFRNTERRYPGDQFAELRARFDDDRRARYAGRDPALVPIVAALPVAIGKQVVEPAAPVGNNGADWFASTGAVRLSAWRNQLTLRSLELYSEYEPGSYIQRIAPTPLLVITAADDRVTPTDDIVAAYALARDPKRLVVIPGGHYDLYGTGRAQGTHAARDWFVAHLQP